MRTFAPGKLVLTGAYAVLEGAPAIVVAVSRGAFADSSRVAKACTPEVRAAIGDGANAPHADAAAMFVGGRKLGLGASAAILVASLAAHAADAGADLSDSAVRDELFAKARDAHAKAQAGGSGVDVAASVHGGAIQYLVGRRPSPVALPPGLSTTVYACGTSARTSELRAEIDRLARTDAAAHRSCMDDLITIANDAASAVGSADGVAFVEALRRTARALSRLGEAAGVGIVPAGFEALEQIAAAEGASFSVSGAGGGDVAVYLGSAEPSPRFAAHAKTLGLFPLDLSLDYKGVRIAPVAPAYAEATRMLSDQT